MNQILNIYTNLFQYMPILLCFFAHVVFLVFAAYRNALMDLISPLDFFKTKKDSSWSKEAMEANKDTNGDGKVSWLEGSFPADKWHVFKREMICYFSGAGALMLVIGILLAPYITAFWQVAVLAIVEYFFVFTCFSVSFEIIYSNYRKNQKS